MFSVYLWKEVVPNVLISIENYFIDTETCARTARCSNGFLLSAVEKLEGV